MTDRDKRTLRIAGIVVGVLLVGFLLSRLLTGGGGEDESASIPRRTTTESTPANGTTESPSLAPSPVLVLPVRDPFAIPPGFPVSGTGTATSGTDTSSGGTTTTTSTGTTTSATTSSPPGSQPGTGPGTGPGSNGSGSTAMTTIGGHQITLLDVSSNGVEQATVEVDSTVYHPSAGERFGPNRQYLLQSVSGNCATFLFGDESFTLCVPQNK